MTRVTRDRSPRRSHAAQRHRDRGMAESSPSSNEATGLAAANRGELRWVLQTLREEALSKGEAEAEESALSSSGGSNAEVLEDIEESEEARSLLNPLEIEWNPLEDWYQLVSGGFKFPFSMKQSEEESENVEKPKKGEPSGQADTQRNDVDDEKVECTICMDSFKKEDMFHLRCSHWYCPEDLKTGFETGLASRKPFRCCRIRVSRNLARKKGILSDSMFQEYNLLIQEHKAKYLVYCSNAQCGSFLPCHTMSGEPILKCEKCKTETCKRCRKAGHPPETCDFGRDEETERLRKMGIRQCPRCKSMVEKEGGCPSMQCRCGMVFCFDCEQKPPCQCMTGIPPRPPRPPRSQRP
ncbi:hypothetical protein FQN54_005902 [Arachnomyces sp. PD_36]|nr:hypothetical protein FQN54_005902 [Arachnomyces sp. PD_36]